LIVRFRPITVKSFICKLKKVEEKAAQLLLPGAHSSGPGEEDKPLPSWVEVFHRYFDLRQNIASKTFQQEQ